MKKTIFAIFFAVSTSMNLSCMELEGSGLPRLFSSSLFITQITQSQVVTTGSSDDNDFNGGNASSVTFDLSSGESQSFVIPRASSPLPSPIPRCDSCHCFSPDKDGSDCDNSSAPNLSDLLQDEALVNSPKKGKVSRTHSSGNIKGDYPFEATKYMVLNWKDFQKKIFRDRTDAFNAKSTCTPRKLPQAISVVITRHGKDCGAGNDSVHKPRASCSDVIVPGSACDSFRHFSGWFLCSSGDERNKKTMSKLFRNGHVSLNQSLDEAYVPELTGISKKKVAKHADCQKMLCVPTYKTPQASETVDEVVARVLNCLHEMGTQHKKILFCSNSFVMNSIISVFNKNKKLVEIGNLDSFILQIYGDYITTFPDQYGNVRIFNPGELSSAYKTLHL